MPARDFPRPGLGSIAGAVTGAGPGFMRGGLAIHIDEYGSFVKNSKIYAGMIDKLGMSFKSFREPLELSLDKVIIPSITQNFAAQGRPAWTPLAQSTIVNRLYQNFPRGPILQRTGRLRRESTRKNIWDISASEVRMRAVYFDQKVPYAQFHQSGTRIRTVTKHTLTTFMEGSSGFTSFNASKKTTKQATMPARPFVLLQLDEEVEIHNIFIDFMQLQVKKHWGEGDNL